MDEETQSRNVTCPFCGLACDDLTIKINARNLEIAENGCALSTLGFAQANENAPQPRVSGKPVELNHAIEVCANILENSEIGRAHV